MAHRKPPRDRAVQSGPNRLVKERTAELIAAGMESSRALEQARAELAKGILTTGRPTAQRKRLGAERNQARRGAPVAQSFDNRLGITDGVPSKPRIAGSIPAGRAIISWVHSGDIRTSPITHFALSYGERAPSVARTTSTGHRDPMREVI